MQRVIVIDWGARHVRLLEGEVRGGRVAVRRLAALALPSSLGGDPARGSEQPVLGEFAGGGATVIGLVERSQAVLRDLRVPDASPTEMPGIVRFQAMRELSFPVDEAAIDFDLVGPPDSDGQRRVILAALHQEVINRYRQATSASRLSLGRLGLRPYATWRAYRAIARPTSDAVLVVTVSGESVELTIGRGEGVLFSRATLLRATSEGGAGGFDPVLALFGEVRRTLAAFANQMPGIAVGHVAVAAAEGEHSGLIETLKSDSSVAVERFDPFSVVDFARGAPRTAGADAPSAGEYVAAVGAALTAADPWPIDFLNPKRPVVVRDRRKPAILIAAAAAVVLIACAYGFAQLKISQGRHEIRKLTQEQVERQKGLREAEQYVRQHQAIADWRADEANVLDEMRRLTDQFPDTKEMHATAVTVSGDSKLGGDGQIVLEGVARQPLPISSFHNKLNRGDHYRAQPTGPIQASSKSGDYRYTFKSQVVVRPAKAVVKTAEVKNEPGTPKGQAKPQPPTTKPQTQPSDDAKSSNNETPKA
jgi:hypothetical protein